MDRLELKFPSKPGFLGLALRFVRDCAESFGFADRALGGIELAAEEAISNSIEHGASVEDEPEIVVVCRRTAQGVEIAVRDRGIPYDPTAASHKAGEGVTLDGESRGLGLLLMKHGVDEVAFRHLGREGKEVTLFKRFERPRPDADGGSGGAAHGQVRELFKLRRSSPVEVRRFEARDAIGVTRCAYLMHGYHFYDADIYDPAALTEMADDGSMHGAVAVTPQDEVAVFAALLRHEPDAPIAELTYALVNPRIRAPGALEQVVGHLSAAHGAWLQGVYTYILANHTHTQNLVQRLGYSPVCVLLNVDDSALKMHFLEGEAQDRKKISNVVFYRYLGSPPAPLVHPPARHRDTILSLYRRLGVEPQLGSGPPPPALEPVDPETRLETRVDHGSGLAWITVVGYGADLRQQALDFVKQCRHLGIRFIEMRLPLRLPQTAGCTGIAEAMGFFFCGILPLGRHGDYLVLQCPTDRVFDLQAIKVASAESRALLDYVIECERSSVAA